ncbi:glutamic acid-rich protein [Anopheles nili]|uniref:glutamic acid-rich protein n=1 Tax=Anopheles nili TaxID=185578 RepID=UPI00237B348B|nr:glutamic acid-rich protein [Anopheles nili]
MRSRTEMVTTTLDGSDFDEESDFEDSEEDWRPEKGESKALKRKTRDILTGTVGGKRGGRSNGRSRGRKSTTKGRSAGRKRKTVDDDEDEDDDDDQSDSDGSEGSSPRHSKRGRKSAGKPQRTYGRKNANSTTPSTSMAAKSLVKLSPSASTSGLDSSSSELASKPIQRKVVNLVSSFPDKSGYLKLLVSRADLEEGIRDNLKVCLWRRDGSSLLQKYFRDKSVDASTPQFTSSMVYSCWEDKRADEYMEIRVRCIEQSKQLRVQIIDVETMEARAKEEYQKFIEKHGTNRSNGTRMGQAKTKHSGDDDEDDDANADDDGDAEDEEEENTDGEDGDEAQAGEVEGEEGSEDAFQEE